MTTTTTRTPLNERPNMDEYDTQTAICTRNPSHRSTNRVAHCSGWEKTDQHGWLCPDCMDELRAENASTVTCPEWCNNCGGYDANDGGFAHRRTWSLKSCGPVLSIYWSTDMHGATRDCGTEIENVAELTVSDLYLIAVAATEAADVMRKYNLVPLDRES